MPPSVSPWLEQFEIAKSPLHNTTPAVGRVPGHWGGEQKEHCEESEVVYGMGFMKWISWYAQEMSISSGFR